MKLRLENEIMRNGLAKKQKQAISLGICAFMSDLRFDFSLMFSLWPSCMCFYHKYSSRLEFSFFLSLSLS